MATLKESLAEAVQIMRATISFKTSAELLTGYPNFPVRKLKKSLRQSILPKSFVWPSTPETGGTRLLKSDLIFDITRHAGYMLLHIQKKPPVLSNRGAADGLYFCSPICCLCSGSGGPLLMQ